MTIPTVVDETDILTSWGNAVALGLNGRDGVATVALSAAQFIDDGASVEPIVFGTATIDPASWWSASPNPERLLPDVAGYYLAIAWCRWDTGGHSFSAAGTIRTRITKNGTTRLYDERQTTDSWDVIQQVGPDLVYLNGTTDYLGIAVDNASTSTTPDTLDVTSCYLSAVCVRPDP